MQHKHTRDISVQSASLVSDQSLQTDDVSFRKVANAFRKLKNFLCCGACRRSGAGLCALVPCGHLVCPGCHEDALEADKLLKGVRCVVCRGLSDHALPSTTTEKLLVMLKEIENDLSSNSRSWVLLRGNSEIRKLPLVKNRYAAEERSSTDEEVAMGSYLEYLAYGYSGYGEHWEVADLQQFDSL
jgi:hypothetical protein